MGSLYRPGLNFWQPARGSRRPLWPYKLDLQSKLMRDVVAWWPMPPFEKAYNFGPQPGFDLTNTGVVWTSDKVMGWVPLFDDAAGDYFQIDQAIVTNYPFSVSQWMRPDALPSSTSFFVGDKDVENQYHVIWISNTGQVRASTVAGSAATATAAVTISANDLIHVVGVWASATDRRVILNGGNKGTDSTNLTPSGLDRTAIGRRSRQTPIQPFSGTIPETIVWKRIIEDDEAAQLWEVGSRWGYYYPLRQRLYLDSPPALDESDLMASRQVMVGP